MPLTEIKMLSPIQLVMYDTPFAPYNGQQLADLAESIKQNGIITPIIVRTAENDKYQILSGHNRVLAAKSAGIYKIPALILENISNDEAAYIVTSSNLFQRSLSDIKYSERAFAFKMHLEATKKLYGGQGKRTDLLSEVDELSIRLTSYLPDTKFNALDKTSETYNLSRASIARHIRLTHLCRELLDMVDSTSLPFLSAVELSYIPHNEQLCLYKIIKENKIILKNSTAHELRILFKSKKFTPENVAKIIYGDSLSKAKQRRINISQNTFDKYFTPNTSKIEISDIIEKALNLYFSKNG